MKQVAASTGKTAEDIAFMGSVMQWLEAHPECKQTDEKALQKCSDFALRLFEQADREEEAANVDWKKVSGIFLRAYHVMDACTQFPDVSDEIVEKNKYAKLKVVTITKTLKNGGTPTPGSFVKVDRNTR
jgi:hypothetical protein